MGQAPPSEWLNYNHLRYFWVVAREGSVTRAAKKLRLTQPTISKQLHDLEAAVGEALFEKQGRRLVLTESGRSAMRFADEIFALGREMVDTLRGRLTGRPTRITIGLADDVPKPVALRIFEPIFRLPEPVRIVCHEDTTDRLADALVKRELDVVIAEAPVPDETLHRHLLGESGLSLFAAPALARKLVDDFPKSLDGAPLILPTSNTALRRQIDTWLEDHGVVPDVVAELQDAALVLAFGAAGVGAFVAPDAIDGSGPTGVKRVGPVKSLEQRFYALTIERRVAHPAVQALLGAKWTKTKR
ncbi:MAG: LysR family transcriptional regulator [Deltaproteobacteria bacterium]|nr:LysR family transcriptional regulator [Deltaproteobacteria bacterium]